MSSRTRNSSSSRSAPAAEPVIELLEAPAAARAAGLIVRGAIASG
jgi:hypothetical protein